MADVKVSALTALTGANLANGDQFLVTDVGSPNVSKSITADELAQGSQFSSRFVAKADEDEQWVAANLLDISFGSPTLDSPGSNIQLPVWLLDAAGNEAIGSSFYVPQHWASFHVDLWWNNQASSSGDVSWYLRTVALADGGSTETGFASVDVIAAAPTTQYQTEVTRMTSTAINRTANSVVMFHIYRAGFLAEDTLANDAGIVGLMFVKAS